VRNFQILKQLRKANGLTQQHVADFLHLDRSTYAYYESGRTKVNLDILLTLSKFYKVSLMQLVGLDETAGQLNDGTDIDSAPPFAIDEAVQSFQKLSRAEQYLIVLYRAATPEQGAEIIEAARKIAIPQGN
jgi:transcriptional regulator with XRE-family HTH domain